MKRSTAICTCAGSFPAAWRWARYRCSFSSSAESALSRLSTTSLTVLALTVRPIAHMRRALMEPRIVRDSGTCRLTAPTRSAVSMSAFTPYTL